MEEQSQFCRLCLNTSVVFYSLLKNNGKEMVSSLTRIEIKEDDLSTESCAKCWLDLKLAYYIQQCFVEAEKKLKNNIEPETIESEIKIENDEFTIKNEANKLEDSDNIEDSDSVEDQDNGEDTDNVENHNIVEEHDNSDRDIVEGAEEYDNTESHDNVSGDDYVGEIIYIQAEENEVEEKPSSCSICGMECKDEIKLYDHINTHYNGPQMCDECLVSFPNIAAYRGHFQTVHPKLYMETHVCGICQLSFKYRSLYNMHLASLHSETAKKGNRKRPLHSPSLEFENPYECKECSKLFTTKQIYNAHMYNHIKKDCPVCGTAITSSNLRKHILTHETEPAVCDICGVTCKHNESLKWHKYYSHSNRKKRCCEICGQEFKKLYDLKVHLKKHTGERNFFCDTCGKGFFTKYRLNIHIRLTHLKERSHICKYCGQAFSKRDAMLTHERIHTNELPYVCEVCGKGFRQNVTLRSHRQSKHNIIESKHTECPECSKMFKDSWALLTHTRAVHA